MVLAHGSPKLAGIIFILDGLVVLPLLDLVLARGGAEVPWVRLDPWALRTDILFPCDCYGQSPPVDLYLADGCIRVRFIGHLNLWGEVGPHHRSILRGLLIYFLLDDVDLIIPRGVARLLIGVVKEKNLRCP